MRRLSQAGFKREFIARAILPDWWDESCRADTSLLQDIDFRVARFLSSPLAVVRDANIALSPPAYPGAKLRRVRDFNRERLGPAIHSALRIAEAVVRSLRNRLPDPARIPPVTGPEWRSQIGHQGPTTVLDDIVDDLWSRGIPVIPLDVLPAPRFQGIACVALGRPVILLGHKHDEPGRVAFLVAHEAGHIAAGDCGPAQPVVDEEDEVIDDSEMERQADHYATQVLVGDDRAPLVEGEDFRRLATRAVDLELETGADASFIIWDWASRTGNYATASMAVQALYRAVGARHTLRKHFAQHVDSDVAGESDRVLLRCVLEDPGLDENTS